MTETNRIKAIDSLSAYEFEVEIDGQRVSGVFNICGLTSFVRDGELPPLIITKMVQQDRAMPFNAWARETLAGDKPTRDVTIIAMDEGRETRRWVYRSAYLTRIAYSDFDSASSELVAEKLTIQAERVEEIWP